MSQRAIIEQMSWSPAEVVALLRADRCDMCWWFQEGETVDGLYRLTSVDGLCRLKPQAWPVKVNERCSYIVSREVVDDRLRRMLKMDG